MMPVEPDNVSQDRDQAAQEAQPEEDLQVEPAVDLPAFEAGGRVERTGIALVHEGEYILPAPGSEAVISPGQPRGAAGQVINYYFPVEIEVIGALTEEQVRRVADYVFETLEAELASRE